jgi:hypothetical protein
VSSIIKLVGENEDSVRRLLLDGVNSKRTKPAQRGRWPRKAGNHDFSANHLGRACGLVPSGIEIRLRGAGRCRA